MKTAGLLSRFDLITDGPGNISLLRRLVVALAMRGELVEECDGVMLPATLLDRIASSRELLVREGRPKPQKTPPQISESELPAASAAKCAFERLANVAILKKGLTGIQSALPGAFPLVVTAEARSTCDHYDFEGGAAIIPMVSSSGHGNASLKRLHYQDDKFALGNILCAAFPIDPELISARFLYEYLTAFKEELLVSRMIGTANVSLTIGKIGEVPVPVLSPVVQRRVSDLMELCDRLEASQAERENCRDRLTAASLQYLSESAAEPTFRKDASFHLQHLSRMTARPDQVAPLRRSILTSAMLGRLVPQSPDEEPAGELLERIRSERLREAEEGKIKTPQTARLTDELTPYSIPPSWQWARFSDVAAIQSNLVDPRSYQDDPHIAPDNIESKTGKLLTYDTIGRSGVFSSKHKFSAGAILYSKIRLALAKAVMVDFDGLCSADMYPILPFIDRGYLHKYMLSEPFVVQSLNEDNRVAMPKINQSALSKILVPVPPLAEQHRIVAKVDELMAMCDQLETQLTIGQRDSRRLLEALLHEALGQAA